MITKIDNNMDNLIHRIINYKVKIKHIDKIENFNEQLMIDLMERLIILQYKLKCKYNK